MKTIKASYQIITPINPGEILAHVERCGRVCYKSEDKITQESAEKFVGMVAGLNHLSVLEHFAITVLFTVDRGVTHEMVRHRIASFSQESTRYCNYSKEGFGNEITCIDIEPALYLDAKTRDMTADQKVAILCRWHDALADAEKHYIAMLALGAPPQIARAVLPNSTKSDIVITANLREWKLIFSLRNSEKAHPQMREVMHPLHAHFKQLLPAIF